MKLKPRLFKKYMLSTHWMPEAGHDAIYQFSWNGVRRLTL